MAKVTLLALFFVASFVASASAEWQDFFYIGFWRETTSVCTETSPCTALAHVAVTGQENTTWLVVDPIPATQRVVLRRFSDPQEPTWGAKVDDVLGPVSGTATARYELIAADVGSATISLKFSASVAGYQLTQRSIEYLDFETASNELSWGLFGSNILIFCVCPNGLNYCDPQLCNQGKPKLQSAVSSNK